MSSFEPITLSPYLTRVLGSGGHGTLPVARRKGRRRGRNRKPTRNTFELRVLGPTQLTDRHGRSILSILAHPRRIALLAYLAIATEDGMADRATLASLFWPGQDASEGERRLEETLRSLVRSMTRSTIVNDGNGRVGVCRERLTTDLDHLQEALESEDRKAVLALNRGPLLQGVALPGLDRLTTWLEAERARIRDRLVAAGAVAGDPRPSREDAPVRSLDPVRMQRQESDRRRRFLDLVLRVG